LTSLLQEKLKRLFGLTLERRETAIEVRKVKEDASTYCNNGSDEVTRTFLERDRGTKCGDESFPKPELTSLVGNFDRLDLRNAEDFDS
jgi:hypothetical protein